MSTHENSRAESVQPTDAITSKESAQSAPNPDLRSLDGLQGTWSLGGDTTGSVTFEWIAGEHFMLQHFDLTLHGHRVIGLEVIGHPRPYGDEPGPGRVAGGGQVGPEVSKRAPANDRTGFNGIPPRRGVGSGWRAGSGCRGRAGSRPTGRVVGG